MSVKRQKGGSVVLSALGAGTVRFELDNPTVIWEVSQISVTTTPAVAGCTATAFLDQQYLCSTIAGSADAAQGPPSVEMSPSQVLEITYVGGPASGVGTVVLYYEEFPRTVDER